MSQRIELKDDVLRKLEQTKPLEGGENPLRRDALEHMAMAAELGRATVDYSNPQVSQMLDNGANGFKIVDQANGGEIVANGVNRTVGGRFSIVRYDLDMKFSPDDDGKAVDKSEAK